MAKSKQKFWVVGEKYLIRCVTHYYVGELVEKNAEEVILTKASWVVDTGRFHDALKGGDMSEYEPFVDDVSVSLGSRVDATKWRHPLPDKQK